jgi:hypothetical protein
MNKLEDVDASSDEQLPNVQKEGQVLSPCQPIYWQTQPWTS